MNPWKKIGLSDYEYHMSLESVQQLQALNRIMKDQFNSYEMLREKTGIHEELHGNVMILGVAGGNGLEHITPKYYEKIYGVDINAGYLAAVKERYTNLSGILECLEKLGFDEMDAFSTPLPNGKYLLRIDFAKPLE